MDPRNKPPVTEYLAHYASPYYDPVKAHEYYMRTRELKGRRSTAKLSDEGKKVWGYTKEQIKAEKKTKVEQARATQKQTVETERAQAKAKREQIAKKLKRMKKKEWGQGERERVAAQLKSAVEAARAAYAAAKADLDSSYEEIYQREFERIAAEMPKVKKARKTKKTGKKNT